ncbi:MAG TPA: hypothetical protein VGL56_11205 [Fimbriimonadaceae bacterium]|jgi:hypothetical protein
MTTLYSLLAIAALGASNLGTVKGHVDLKGIGLASNYEVHFITRPAAASPGHMQSMMMRLALSTQLENSGDFIARIQPGTYEVDLFPKPGQGLKAQLPRGTVVVKANKTVKVTLRSRVQSEAMD